MLLFYLSSELTPFSFSTFQLCYYPLRETFLTSLSKTKSITCPYSTVHLSIHPSVRLSKTEVFFFLFIWLLQLLSFRFQHNRLISAVETFPGILQVLSWYLLAVKSWNSSGLDLSFYITNLSHKVILTFSLILIFNLISLTWLTCFNLLLLLFSLLL